jgi:small subunit ribosomal protein S17
MANTTPEKKSTRGLRKSMVGIVTSDKMMKTVVVTVSRKVKDPLYQKYVTHKSKFKAHDEKNEAKVGDTVLIYETAPISKDKKWKLGKILSRGVEV